MFNTLQYLSLKTGGVTQQTQKRWQRGHQGATRHIRFEFLVQNLIEGASSGIFWKTVDVCVDVFNAFQCLSCSVAQRIHRWGPTYHWEPRSSLNGMTIKVKWEVHSGPFKGLSQHTQGFEFDDEWYCKGQRSFVGPQSRVSEWGQDQESSSLCLTLLSKV